MITFISFTGGISWLTRDEESAFFFSPGDEVMFAWQLERILTDQGLAERLSDNARITAQVRNNPETIIKDQLEIYIRSINEDN